MGSAFDDFDDDAGDDDSPHPHLCVSNSELALSLQMLSHLLGISRQSAHTLTCCKIMYVAPQTEQVNL